MPRYYLIAGEASGDLHASNLIRELTKLNPGSEFRGFGGDRMMAMGTTIVKHIRDLDFMGFWEVLINLPVIMRQFKECKEDIQAWKPDALILIDYPGFNLRMAEFAKKIGIPVFYYISPQIWAWKQGRIRKIRRNVNRMFVILPFEKEFYTRFGYEVDFVGHPLLDEIRMDEQTKHPDVIPDQQSKEPLIAILPGSRPQEIRRMLPVMLQVARDFRPGYRFVVAGVSKVNPAVYSTLMANSDVPIVYGNTYPLLRSAAAAVVTSGTATLEAALLNVPQVVCYKASGLSYLIAKNLVKLRFISLVNLILNKRVVTELIQSSMNAKALRIELEEILLNRDKSSAIIADYEVLRKVLGQQGASATTAKLISNSINPLH